MFEMTFVSKQHVNSKLSRFNPCKFTLVARSSYFFPATRETKPSKSGDAIADGNPNYVRLSLV